MLGKVLLFMLPVGIVISLMTGFGKKERPLEKTLLGLKVFLIGFPIGVYDGFFGPGTGSFMIIALNIVLGLGLVRASATTKVMNLASNAGALFLCGRRRCAVPACHTLRSCQYRR